MGDASRVGEVRRWAAQITEELQWNETDAGRLAIVATELATNLVRHAQQGEIWIATRAAFHEVEIIAVDRGPGIDDVAQAMRDGMSTGSGSPGTGLGALSRMADDFDIQSSVGGTICVVRVRPGSAKRTSLSRALGVVCLAVPPETVSGDAWGVAADHDVLSVIVADGLGHGPLAGEAAQAAIHSFAQDPFAPLATQLQSSHRALQGTRGAAVLTVRVEGPVLEFCGAGNVMGRVFSGISDRAVLGQHGTVGVQIAKPIPSSLTRPEYAALVLYSDGITSRWKPQDYVALLGRDASLMAASILWHNTRNRDDATVVVIKAKESL